MHQRRTKKEKNSITLKDGNFNIQKSSSVKNMLYRVPKRLITSLFPVSTILFAFFTLHTHTYNPFFSPPHTHTTEEDYTVESCSHNYCLTF